MRVLKKKAVTKKKGNFQLTPKRSVSVLLCLLVIVFAGWIIASSVSNYKKAKEYRIEAEKKEQQAQETLEKNEEIERRLNEGNLDEYIEKIAREQYGYAKPGERVVYDSSFGN